MARLKIVLPSNWIDVSAENPDGPPTYCRDNDDEAGALQISIQAEYKGGEIPNPTLEDLVGLAGGVAKKFGKHTVRGQGKGGNCTLGTYGTVLISTPECAWVQVWVMSNGRDFVLATHICTSEPSAEEVNEASAIVKNVKLS